MNLLPKKLLVRTGPFDRAEWNYRGLLGSVQRKRFHLIQQLIGKRRFHRLLELGFGSGIFIPPLTQYCKDYYGIDTHGKIEEVSKALAEIGIRPNLFHADMASTPFQEKFFDCIVGVSVLEFVDDLQRVCMELRRILNPEGRVYIVTPGFSPIVDLGFKILTGKDAREDFFDRRERVVPILREHFEIEKIKRFPLSGFLLFNLYQSFALRLRKYKP